MRKIIICLSFIIILTACNKPEDIKPITSNLGFTLHTVWNKTEYILDGSTDQNSNLFLSVTEPKELKNFKFSFLGENAIINYLDLQKEIPLKSLEEDSPLRVAFEGFKMAQNSSKVYMENNENFIKFSLGNQDYRFIITQSGLPISIKSQNNNIIMFKGLEVFQ